MLNKAVWKGDLKGAGVAQMMKDTATSKIEKLRREVDKVRKSQKQVEKEKRKLLENILESKSRSSTARKEKSITGISYINFGLMILILLQFCH